MARIAEMVEGYLEYKHGLGYRVQSEGATLRRFAADMEDAGYDGPMSSSAAIGWIGGFDNPSPWYKSRLYETLRTFSRYACVVDGESTALPKGSGACHGRTNPHIYTDDEAAAMMSALGSLHSPDGLRAASMPLAFGIMYSCGLRPSECANLTVGDYDGDAGAITVTATKFNRQRVVPLSQSTAAAIEGHLDGLPSPSPRSPILQRTGGRRLDARAFQYAWQLARPSILPDGGEWAGRAPRPYDCRHSFCVHTLERWLAEGRDVDALMPFLSTYMGHAKLADTYWYLTATETLLDTASNVFWAHVGGDIRG